MTKDEIKKALECCSNPSINPCKDCPYNKNGDFSYCNDKILKDTLNLITEQNAEIERLKAENETYCKQINQAYDTGYDDGYKSCQDDIKKADELLKEYKNDTL